MKSPPVTETTPTVEEAHPNGNGTLPHEALDIPLTKKIKAAPAEGAVEEN